MNRPAWEERQRNIESSVLREIHNSVIKPKDYDERNGVNWQIVGDYITGILAVLCAVAILMGCPLASAEESIEGYTVSQYVEAIYQAEGGAKAQYPYGIRSVKCETKEECRKVCFNTVRNNRKRYSKASANSDISFLEFLSKRYAPCGVSNDPKGLNYHWLKNVRYFLARSK